MRRSRSEEECPPLDFGQAAAVFRAGPSGAGAGRSPAWAGAASPRIAQPRLRHLVIHIVQPSVPFRRHLGPLGLALIHPAPHAAEPAAAERLRRDVFQLLVPVAVFAGAHKLAVQPCQQPCSESCAHLVPTLRPALSHCRGDSAKPGSRLQNLVENPAKIIALRENRSFSRYTVYMTVPPPARLPASVKSKSATPVCRRDR
jgi:hypothetical protein